MNFYIENKSFAFVKKAYNRVNANVKKTVFKAFLINYKGNFSKRPYRFLKKRGIYDVEYVLFGVKGLGGALKCLNLSKNPITLTLVIDKALNGKSKKLLMKAKKAIKVIDKSGSVENLEFYKASNKILYNSEDVNMPLDVDIMHIYKFYEPLFGCNFSSCLGKNIYVDRRGQVYFCPKYPEKSLIGTLDDTKNYFEAEKFNDTLKGAIEKRNQCKNDCKYYEYCAGACPLQEGCFDFPALFEKNSAYIDKIIKSGEDLSKQNYTVAKIIVKDIAYGE